MHLHALWLSRCAIISFVLAVSAATAHAEIVTQFVWGSEGGFNEELLLPMSGVASDTFTRNYGVAQFDSSAGTLLQVDIRWGGGRLNSLVQPGEVRLGVFPRGSLFNGGSGTVAGDATLSLEMNLPASTAVGGSASNSGSHTGAVAGGAGVGEADFILLSLGFNGSQTFTDPLDLALFQGVGSVDFTSALELNVDAQVDVVGPSFGFNMIPSRIATRVEITYTYDRVIPEPSTYIMAAMGVVAILGLRRRK